jgi:betaine lipid synthase
MFGEGRHENFRELLMSKLSPHLSSYAFQFWLQNGPKIFGSTGLYYSGGSGHAIALAGWLFHIFGLKEEVKSMCSAQTLVEQKEIWENHLRGVLLNRLLSWTIVQNEKWLWKALGVPANQRNIIMTDYAADCEVKGQPKRNSFGRAIWEYVVNTLDPVVSHTLLSEDNHYYLLCLQGQYSRKSHADYLTPAAHAKLSQAHAFDGLRIHTDEIMEVIDRMKPGTLTIAVVMDSMDWFNPDGDEAEMQIRALNKALKIKGRVMLRSAGLQPWYLKKFEENGFQTKCMGKRTPGTCIDRYVSQCKNEPIC